MDKNGGRKEEVSKYSVESLLSHSAEKLRRGTPLCFIKFRVSKNVRDKRGGRESHISVESFLSQSTETFRRQTVLRCVSEKFR